VRSRVIAVVSGVVLLAAGLTACSKTGDDNSGNGDVATQSAGAIDLDPKHSMGPAAAIPGATKGGTITLLRGSDYSHLDPARQYTLGAMSLGRLFARPLTTFKQSQDGKLTLVGDTATTPGLDVNKDCKTWKFTIKDGLKFEDGSAITAKDIAYGIARSFDVNLSSGPTYIQSWLVNNPQYQDVFDFEKDKTALPPGLTVPDDKTLQMQFQQPHCDLPFAASLPETAPVPAAKDTLTGYDTQPVSSGPYKIDHYTKGKELVLVRNTNWDPASDAVRTAYPDGFKVEIGPDIDAQTNRMIADAPADQATISTNGVSSALTAKVIGDATVMARAINEPGPDLSVLSINTQRVTDLKVRQALNYAIDRQDYLKSIGGVTAGTAVSTLLPPQVFGYAKYNAYDGGDTGNIDKAKELLGGQHPELVLATSSGGVTDDINELKSNLEKAGFKITIRQVNADTFYDDKEKKDNPWDLYLTDWVYDWPSGSSVIPILYDGRTIRPTSNKDTAYFNADDVNAEIDRISTLPAGQQGEAWMALDKKIMTEYAPVVPLYVSQAFYLYGSKVGGLFASRTLGYPDFVSVYVKQ
jgi:peptide/nickel transport system substrate-binding protein